MNNRIWFEIRDALLNDVGQHPLIMGILNLTPDSFSDGGQYRATADAISRAQDMVAEGAHIIDIGGESTRPGAVAVSEAEEMRRTIGIVEQLAQDHVAPLSIDTYKSAVARQAIAAGAVIVNDISGMRRDPELASVVAETGSIVVVTYNRGETDPSINLVDDTRSFFDGAFDVARNVGIPREHVWLDPGVGFSKTQTQNFEILRRLDVLESYGCPILVGLSRKSFIGALLDVPVEDRLPGTIAANLFSLSKGARIFRVHDVKANADALNLQSALMTE